MPRILILDDDSAIRFAMEDYFNLKGFDVDSVGSVADGEAAVLARLPDVVISDLRLTPADKTEGLDFIGWLGERFPQVVTLVVTAYGSSQTETAARRLGARAVLQKPQSMAALLALVEAELAAPRPAPQASLDEDLVEALWTDLDGATERSRIATVVREVSGELAGATVPSYVPVIKRRMALTRLRAERSVHRAGPSLDGPCAAAH